MSILNPSTINESQFSIKQHPEKSIRATETAQSLIIRHQEFRVDPSHFQIPDDLLVFSIPINSWIFPIKGSMIPIIATYTGKRCDYKPSAYPAIQKIDQVYYMAFPHQIHPIPEWLHNFFLYVNSIYRKNGSKAPSFQDGFFSINTNTILYFMC